MHFEILVEDQSGQCMLEHVLPKILGSEHSFRTHAYRGIGRIPKGLRATGDASRRLLLDRLPSLLAGYGRWERSGYRHAVIVVCDLDDKCLKAFLATLNEVLARCEPAPLTRFCVAIEEGEAWLLGDPEAILRAYPNAKCTKLASYTNDSVCGTWEFLADVVFPGGLKRLKEALGNPGHAKYEWANAIAPHMDVERNNSPSFQYFRRKVLELASLDNVRPQA